MRKLFCLFLCLYFFLPFASTVSKGDRNRKTTSQSEKKHLSDKATKDSKATDGQSGKPDLETFKQMLNILDREEVSSEKYKRAARDLEVSYYHNASFETLELLSKTYGEKGDGKNQIKILKRLTSEYPDNSRGYYLLGQIYKKKYTKSKELEKDPCRIRYNKLQDKTNKQLAIEQFSLAIEKNPKHEEAYLELLPLLKEEERWEDTMPTTQKKKKTAKTKKSQGSLQTDEATGLEVLNLAKDMARYFRKSKYYVDLCEAYYKNRFSSQAIKACRIAVKKNPKKPRAHLYHALAQDPNKVESHLIKAADKFPRSELIQTYVGKWFLDKTPDLAVKYFISVIAINPKNSKVHYHLADLSLKSRRFEESYKSFQMACSLDLKYIRDFKKAKERLFYLGKEAKRFIPQFEKGIDECFKHFKETKACS